MDAKLEDKHSQREEPTGEAKNNGTRKRGSRSSSKNIQETPIAADEKTSRKDPETDGEQGDNTAQAKDADAKGTPARRKSSRGAKEGNNDEEEAIVASNRRQELSLDKIDEEGRVIQNRQNRQNTTVIPSRTVSITSTTLNISPTRIAQRKDSGDEEDEEDNHFTYDSSSLRRPSRQEIEARQVKAAIDSFGSDYHYNDAPPANSSSSSGSNATTRANKDIESSNDTRVNNNDNDKDTAHLTTEQIDFSKNYLLRPCKRGDGPLLCYIERDKSGFNYLSPVYRLYIEATNSTHNTSAFSPCTAAAAHNQPSSYPETEGSKFVMAAKKKLGSKTSYHLMSLDHTPDVENRGSRAVIGKVRGDQIGTQYLFTDHGMAPGASVLPSMLRKELGLTRFKFNNGGPSQIDAWIPMVNPSGSSAVVWQPTDPFVETIEATVNASSSSSSSPPSPSNVDDPAPHPRTDRLMKLYNKRPKWDAKYGGHVLNFHGRVTESSVKNFQLCSSETGEDVVLQFGKVGKDRFSMDVRYPLSIYQAFSICVACMDRKLADRQAYGMFKRLTDRSSSSSSGRKGK